MFSGSGELEVRDSLLIYRDRAAGTLIFWYGAGRDADIEDPAVWAGANPASWRDAGTLATEFTALKNRGALLEWRRYHLNQFLGTEDAWLHGGVWSGTRGDLPLDPARPIGVGIDKSPDGALGAVAIAPSSRAIGSW
jgi:phage terminase large subunit-like protein